MQAYEIVEKIEKLREERGWTYYRLAEEACLSQTTLLNMRARGTLPSITTLAGICDAFGITLAEFFSEGERAETLTSDERALLVSYRKLSFGNKKAVKSLIENLQP